MQFIEDDFMVGIADFGKTRMIDGVSFTHVTAVPNKTNAKIIADAWKSRGFHVRVIVKQGWNAVYVHKGKLKRKKKEKYR